jgi:uncharacterized repeat protein (TIGR03803 family)
MKKLYVLFSVLVVLLHVTIAQAQERLWGLHNGVIFSIRTDGTDYQTITNPGDGEGDAVLGFTRTGNKMLYTKTSTDPALGYIGMLSGNGAVDLEENCRTCISGTEGMTTATNGNIYVPFQSQIGPEIYGVIIYTPAIVGENTVGHIKPKTEMTDEFYLTGTPQGVYGLSRGYTGHNGFIYRLNDDANGYQAIYYFTGGENGFHPTGKLTEGTDGSLFGETMHGGRDNKGIYFKVNKDGSNFAKLGDIADGKRTDLIAGNFRILANHITAGYKPLRDSKGFAYLSTPLGIYKVWTNGPFLGNPALKLTSHSGFLVDLFDASGSSAVKVNNVVSGATNVPVDISLELNEVPGNQGYEVQVSTDADFKSNVKIYHWAYSALPPMHLMGSTTYYVRARAASWPYFGEVVHFTTETVIDFAQERLWGLNTSNETIFSMKKDGTDLIYHQKYAGGFKELSNHQILVTTNPDGDERMSRIDRDGVKRIYTLDYQEAHTVGQSMIEISPGRLVGVEFGAGAKVRGIDEFLADGSSYTHSVFRSTRDLSYDLGLAKTPHGIYGVSRGDSNNKGFIYRVNDDKRGFTIVYQFQGLDDGKQPVGKIYAGEGDFIFGQTQRGGVLNKGIYFKVKDDGTSFTKIADVHNGQPWVGAAGQTYPNLQRLVNAGWPGECKDSEGNYYVTDHFGFILKISPDFHLVKIISNAPFSDNLAVIAPAFHPETFVKNIQDGAEHIPNNLTLVTDSFPGATQYFFELSTYDDFSTIELSVSNTKPYAGVTGLRAGYRYFARVRPNVWPYYGRVTSFVVDEGLSSNTTHLAYKFVASSGAEAIGYSDKDGNDILALQADPFELYDNDILPLSNGEILYKANDQLTRLTKDGLVKLFGPLEMADDNWMPDSWVEGYDGYVYALRYSVTGTQLVGLVKFNPDGSEYIVKNVSVPQFNGYTPKLTPTPSGIFGVNQGTGGSNGYIFKLKGDLSGIDIIYTFSGTSKPQGQLYLDSDGYFYGVTRSGGINGGGVIYRVRTDGADYSVLHHFSHNTGESPAVGLIDGRNGWLYGLTFSGGKENKGVLFRIDKNSHAYEVMKHFADVGGQNPRHPLVIDEAFNIYGSVSGFGYFKTNVDGAFFTDLVRVQPTEGVDRIFLLRQNFVPDVQLVNPPDQGTFPYGAYELTVSTLPGARNYVLEISESPLFDKQTSSYNSTSDGQVFTGSPKPSKTYYARVRSRLLPFWGPTTSFTIDDPPSLSLLEETDASARISTESISQAYPNPSVGAFTLRNDAGVKSIVVTDASGIVVYENKVIDNTTSLQFGGELKRGVYILKVVTDEGVTTSRLIKN